MKAVDAQVLQNGYHPFELGDVRKPYREPMVLSTSAEDALVHIWLIHNDVTVVVVARNIPRTPAVGYCNKMQAKRQAF